MNERPKARVQLCFEVVEYGQAVIHGEHRWAVLCGVAVFQSDLLHREACELAAAMNSDAAGFRQLIGLAGPEEKQLLLELRRKPMAYARGKTNVPAIVPLRAAV